MVNVIEDDEKTIQESRYTDIHTLLDEDALKAIQRETKTFREILIDGLKREVVAIHQTVRAGETTFTVERIDQERLTRDVLYDEAFYNMTRTS